MSHSTADNSTSKLWLMQFGIAALYVLFGAIIHHYVISYGIVSVIWPGGGLLLAALLIGGRRFIWGALLGSLLLNALFNDSLWAIFGITLANVLEVLAGFWLLTRNDRADFSPDTLAGYLRLIVLGGGVASLVGALIGPLSLLFAGIINPIDYFGDGFCWWMGDVLGVVLVTPFILAWWQASAMQGTTTQRLEKLLLISITFIAGQIVFLGWLHGPLSNTPKGYLMFLFVSWVAIRLGVCWVTLVVLMMALQAISGALQGVGFFAHDIARADLYNYWSYMLIISLVGMTIATYINEIKQAQAALANSTNLLRTIINTIPARVFWKDKELHYLGCNTAFAKDAGEGAPSDMLGKNDFQLSWKEQAELYRADDRRVMDSGIAKLSYDEPQTTPDGRTIWLRTSKVPLHDDANETIGVLGIYEDITEHKIKEAELERLSRIYHLLSQVNAAIVRSHDKNELFMTICNSAIESALFRFAWVGLLDEQKLAVLPVAYAGVEEGYIAKLNIRFDDELTGNGPTCRAIRSDLHIICQNIEQDASMVPWQYEAKKRGYRSFGVFPIHEAGGVVGTIIAYAADTNFFTSDIIRLMLGLAADVSFALDVFADKQRRTSAEERINQLNVELENRVLQRTHQLEEVNRELESFSYSVSHDLRAPLRSINGFSQILSNKYREQLDATGQNYLARVRHASERMGWLIDDLLMLARVTRGALKREPVDLSAFAKNVMNDLRKTAPDRQVNFVVQPELSAYANAGLLRIVMDNLLGNAYKFTGKKNDAKIEFGRCDCDGESAFFVRDNGDGFNMEYAHKLFGAFQRLHGADEFEGTGIGLATVQRIIHRHRGRVWAEAKEGAGATFYFTLPQRERNAGAGV